MYRVVIYDYYESDESEIASLRSANNRLIHDRIIEHINQKYIGAERDYLLYCAYWDESEYEKGVWIAHSPIAHPYTCGCFWPLYNIHLSYNNSTNIVFKAWKGDYEDAERSYLPSGNLGLTKPKDLAFKGIIWTRG
jgi:hypothetical protein